MGVIVNPFGRDRHTLGEEGTHLPVTETERYTYREAPGWLVNADEAVEMGSAGTSSTIRLFSPLLMASLMTAEYLST